LSDEDERAVARLQGFRSHVAALVIEDEFELISI
jgi:hypothetical protein